MTRPGRLILAPLLTRAEARARPAALFAFGDNMSRTGRGGQAAEMRGEANAVGIPTKWRPARDPGAYFRDADADHPDVRAALRAAFDRLEAALAAGGDVVWPEAGIGTGLAELETRAPRLHRYIAARFARLEHLARRAP